MNRKLIKAMSIVLSLTCVCSLGACGKTKKKKGTLSADLYQVMESASTATTYKSNAKHFKTKVAPKAGMDEKAAESFINDEGWTAFQINLIIHNGKDKPYTFADLVLEEALNNNAYILTESPDGDISIPVSGRENLSYIVFANTSEISNDELLRWISETKMQVQYYDSALEEESEDEIPANKIKLLDVNKQLAFPSDDNQKNPDASVTFGEIEDGSDFLNVLKKNEIAFSNEAKLFGLDSDTAPKVVAKDSKWECYVLNLTVENTSEYDLTFYDIDNKDNGKNGVWISRLSQYGEFSIESGDKQDMPVSVLVDKDKTGDTDVGKLIKSSKLTVTYSITPMIDANGQETIELKQTLEVK